MDSLYGRRALAALRPATEAGVDLTYPRGRRFAEDSGGDLLVTKRIARANDHPMPLPSLTQQIAGQGWSLHGARARRCFAGHRCNVELRTGMRPCSSAPAATPNGEHPLTTGGIGVFSCARQPRDAAGNTAGCSNVLFQLQTNFQSRNEATRLRAERTPSERRKPR
jgi:hypothetical protein